MSATNLKAGPYGFVYQGFHAPRHSAPLRANIWQSDVNECSSLTADLG